jgi:hypothetical protein
MLGVSWGILNHCSCDFNIFFRARFLKEKNICLNAATKGILLKKQCHFAELTQWQTIQFFFFGKTAQQPLHLRRKDRGRSVVIALNYLKFIYL